MGYDYTVKDFYQVKDSKEYPWPCPSNKDRKVEVFASDILWKTKEGVYDMETGIYKIGILIPDEDVKLHTEEKRLRLS